MQQSFHRFLRPAAQLAVLLAFLVCLPHLAVPARAAEPEVNFIKIFEKKDTEKPTSGLIKTETVEFYWNGEGRPVLSSTPDGAGSISYFNILRLEIDGITMQKPYQCTEISGGALPPRSPWNITSLLKNRLNKLQVSIESTCGWVGNTDIYLVNVGGVFSLPVPPPAPEVEPAPPPKLSPQCAQPQLFGVRGSGETKKSYSGYGETVGMFRSLMIINRPGIKTDAIDYPAIAVNPASFTYSGDYVDSVERGVEALTEQVRKFIKKCPRTYLLLAGYSQGAEVVGIAYTRFTEYERHRIASVTLFGDPRFNPSQVGVNQGDTTPGLGGIDVSILGDLRAWTPTGWSSRVQSYCTDGDPICNFDVRYLAMCNIFTMSVTCPHGMYYERGWVEMATAWAVENLRRLPPL